MRFLKADKLFNGLGYLDSSQVMVLDDQNRLKEIVPEQVLGTNSIEKLEGIITPGFINAHCHLELSHLRSKIPRHTGLPAFARQVVTLRNSVSTEEIAAAMQQADADMWNAGIVAAGDISNTEDSFAQKQQSPVFYHTFIELIGLNPAHAKGILDKGTVLLSRLKALGLAGSLAPHAPYSTSKELIRHISDYNHAQAAPWSIHNQESEEENKFFEGKPSAFEELYRSLGLDISWFRPPGTSSLDYYGEALPDSGAMLVHNTLTSRGEIDRSAREKNNFWCFCPGANLYIENRLPDFALFSKYKNRVCIGTDSLASNAQLDVVAEAALILTQSSAFRPEEILQCLTFNGAEALGISDKYGKFITGKNAGLNLVAIKGRAIEFIKKIA